MTWLEATLLDVAFGGLFPALQESPSRSLRMSRIGRRSSLTSFTESLASDPASHNAHATGEAGTKRAICICSCDKLALGTLDSTLSMSDPFQKLRTRHRAIGPRLARSHR